MIVQYPKCSSLEVRVFKKTGTTMMIIYLIILIIKYCLIPSVKLTVHLSDPWDTIVVVVIRQALIV